jgi:CRP-like cAMP-binding protein
MLQSCKLFRQLPPEEIRFLQSVAAERVFSAGTEIFHEGDHGDGMYLVKDAANHPADFFANRTR